MASQTWPGSLPQDTFRQLDLEPEDNRLRTQMDSGPVKMRRRFTAVPIKKRHSMTLRGDDFQTFKNFYETTLKDGTLRFDWTDPVDGTTVEMRFVTPYTASLAAGGSANERVWEINMNLEIMP